MPLSMASGAVLIAVAGVIGLHALSLPHSEALPSCGQDRGAFGEAVDQRRREFLVAAEYGRPFGEREVRGHERAASSRVAIGDQVEEQLAAGAIERHEAEL